MNSIVLLYTLELGMELLLFSSVYVKGLLTHLIDSISFFTKPLRTLVCTDSEAGSVALASGVHFCLIYALPSSSMHNTSNQEHTVEALGLLDEDMEHIVAADVTASAGIHVCQQCAPCFRKKIERNVADTTGTRMLEHPCEGC